MIKNRDEGKVVLEQFLKILQYTMANEGSPAEWKDSITIPFTKEKEILYSVGNIEA